MSKVSTKEESKVFVALKDAAKISGIIVVGAAVGASLPFLMPVALPVTGGASAILGTAATWFGAGKLGVSFVFAAGAWTPTIVPTVFIAQNANGALFAGFLGGAASTGAFGTIYSTYKVVSKGVSAIASIFPKKDQKPTKATVESLLKRYIIESSVPSEDGTPVYVVKNDTDKDKLIPVPLDIDRNTVILNIPEGLLIKLYEVDKHFIQHKLVKDVVCTLEIAKKMKKEAEEAAFKEQCEVLARIQDIYPDNRDKQDTRALRKEITRLNCIDI